jgi:hypothetical protein
MGTYRPGRMPNELLDRDGRVACFVPIEQIKYLCDTIYYVATLQLLLGCALVLRI